MRSSEASIWVERSAVVFHQAESKLLLEVVAAHVGHVDRHAGKVPVGLAAALLQGGIRHLADIAAKPRPQGQKLISYRPAVQASSLRPLRCEFRSVQRNSESS